jgi:primary-amine oxidase
MTATIEPTTVVLHPLEPLSAAEVSAAAAILKSSDVFVEGSRFVYVELAEPVKGEVTAWAPGTAWDRQAAALLRNPRTKSTYEAVVSLTRGVVISWRTVEGMQTPATYEEFMACEDVVRADPRWQEAMVKRGVTDFSLCMVDPWACGYTGPQDEPSERRILRPLTFVRASEFDNGYARPVEGLIVTVDLDEMKVVAVEDHGIVPLPPLAGNYEPDLMVQPGNVAGFTEARTPLKPVSITQPEGASFTVRGHYIEWANWRLRIGFTPREGLVLHDVRYVDKGTLRPILHRASLAEMYVPYGDPAPTHRNKNVFDMGEYGLGWLANSLTLGCDCLGEIFYFDGVVNDQDGEPMVIGNAVCMHEEDASVGWKHTDFRTLRGEVRRNRRLVISFFATVGNYEYGIYWYLSLDGSIELEIKLTGILSTGAVPEGTTPEYGTLIAPGLYAPNHEHYFSVRMDMRVDGDKNTVYEVDSVSPGPVGPANPHGNAWKAVKTPITSESMGGRDGNPVNGRSWLITSADKTSKLGLPTAYKLEPGSYTAPLWADGSVQSKRGGFATRQLWVTAYDPAQRYAAGDYIAQNISGDGVPRYAEADRPLTAADVVLWYTVGAHHVVRPEDWPVMTVAKVGFHLKPFGFFDGNPMLDVPAEKAACHTGPTGTASGCDHCGAECTCH